jgi:hypothetical protein
MQDLDSFILPIPGSDNDIPIPAIPILPMILVSCLLKTLSPDLVLAPQGLGPVSETCQLTRLPPKKAKKITRKPLGGISITGPKQKAPASTPPSGTQKGIVGGHKMHILPPSDLYFIQDIEDRCLLLTSSMSFVDLPFQEHRMMEKHHMDQNLCISS